MSLLFETIQCFNGVFQNLEAHNYRLNHSRKEVFGSDDKLQLQDNLLVPAEYASGLVKCKVIYGENIENIIFEHYEPRKVNTLKLIESDISYDHKWTDRNKINHLYERRGKADDILIVKNGFITDTSIANILFYNGQQWITPSSVLLSGTQRAKLIDEGLVIEKEVTVDTITSYESFMLINAMTPFDVSRAISTSYIQ